DKEKIMKPQISTNTEQSRRLLSCGVDPKTADMCIITYPNGYQQAYVGQVTIDADSIYTDGELQAEYVILKGEPVWSLSRMLELIPSKIIAPHANTLCYFRLYHKPGKWMAMYHDGKNIRDAEDYYWQCMSQQEGEDPIEVCAMMIEWLTANNYPLNKI
ncbi:MAG: hypothetical protein NC548_63165, partial [Lachnospiraceae bacterium]|nr:hypothetical protein [Lachnospiraceae bacterium]